MKCLLMNKNKEIALIELNDTLNIIENIYEIYNIDFSPLSFKNAYFDKSKNNTKVLNDWYRGRGIPDWRKDIKNLLENLNIKSPDELLNKSYALSLSDQYWIKEEKQTSLKWENINFFDNDFKYDGFLKVSLSSNLGNEHVDLKSPNNTTDGMLQKAWIIENNKRVLVKGTYYPPNQEPINEWLASEICKRLNLYYCNYNIDVIANKIVSKCENFISKNEEIITAYDIFYSEKKDNNTNDYTHYINILEKNGINNAKKSLNDMMLVDYIVMNFDRHLGNFGVIRNVETLEWEKVTPIFDTGESMQCNKIQNEINFNDGTCKFFTNTNKKISGLLDYIDITRYDLQSLTAISEEFKEKLENYKIYTDMSEERINILTKGLENRINNLCKYQKKAISFLNSDIKIKEFEEIEEDEEEI